MDRKKEDTFEIIQKEQQNFNDMIDSLIEQGNFGKFVLFKEGQVQNFFNSETEAFGEGIKKFGIDGNFIVDRVVKRKTQAISLSWELGITIGK